MNSPWISCVCLVNFEIEKGQEIEQVFPENFTLSDEEKRNISFYSLPDCSLPDSNNCGSGSDRNTLFHFNLRTKQPLSKEHISFNRDCKSDLRADEGHIWGYVVFRQKKDSSIRRGYFQKSFVFLTRIPFHSLWYELVSKWANLYFLNGQSALDTGLNSILSWPMLSANISLQLPFFQMVFQIFLPASNRTQLSEPTSPREDDSSNNNININYSSISIPSVNEIDIFGAIHPVIHQSQLIWELVLLGEPILIIATSPTDTSLLVQALTSMIAPLEYQYEIFPYFTIHNNEYILEFANASKPPSPPCILGVTNPYFAKTLSMMHTIKICEALQVHQNSSDHPLPHQRFERVKSQKALMDASSSMIYTDYKPFLQKDKQFVKKILNGVKSRRPKLVQSIILRRYFLELTQSFMIPLERYMTSLMPLFKDVSPFRSVPAPSKFNEEAFLATLEISGPHLTSTVRGDYQNLYKRFFKSLNFLKWYSDRRFEQLKALEELHQEALAKEDFHKWICGKQEVEIVDMILSIKKKLHLPVNSNSTLPNESAIAVDMRKDIREMLLKKLNDLLSSLPDDLKTILI